MDLYIFGNIRNFKSLCTDIIYMQKFIDKYTPKTLDEIVGNKKTITEIKYWAKDHKTPLFIYGDTGIGKTLTAKLLAKEMGWALYHTDASDIRGKDAIANLFNIATTSNTIFGKKRLILIDEVDAIEDKRGSSDSGFFTELIKILDKTKQPIILIANDAYENKKLRPVFEKCEKAKFDLPNKLSILKFATEICEKEGIDYDLVSLKQLVENTKNDVRALLMDLWTLSLNKKITLEDVESLGDRKKDEDVFKTLGAIFYPKSFSETRASIDNSNIDWELLFAWLEENIPRKFKNPKNLAAGFEVLSKADLYQGRIQASRWILLKYVLDYLSVGVAYSKTEKEEYSSFAPFTFPTILQKLSGTKKERVILNAVVDKMGEKIHASHHIIKRDYLPIFLIIAETNKFNSDIINYFNLEMEEAKALGCKVTEKKYEEITGKIIEKEKKKKE